MGVEIFSDQPGFQFYTGNMMEQHYNGKYNRNYGQQYALCFESQLFPNAINQKNFQSPVLYKNKKYESKIIMRLGNNFNE